MFYTPPPSGGGSGTLQTVTDAGNATTNAIIINGSSLYVGNGDVQIGSNSGNGQLVISQGVGGSPATSLRWSNSQKRAQLLLYREVGVNSGSTTLVPSNSVGNIDVELPAIAGTLAPYTDTNGNLNYAGFFINAASNVWGSLIYDGVEGALELVNGAGFVSNLKTLATSARVNTLPDEDGTLAIKKFDEYNTTIQQTGGSSPILQGDEISTNAALTASFNRSATGIYEVVLSLVTTKIVASATSCAALTTGNPYLVLVEKLNTTTVQLTVLDAIGVPTDDWEFLNITIKYTI